MSDFDSMVDDNAVPQASVAPAGSFDSMVDDSEQPTDTGGAIRAGLEGVAEGVTGPVVPYIEKHLFHQVGSDILKNQEQHPIAHGVGQAVGLLGSAATGIGEGALLGKAGQVASEAVGLGHEAAQAASLGFKVGSSAVTQAAEMAVLQGSDEASKMILNDPNTSAESAISNIGLASALGAGAGAIGTGVISPLWKATVGPKIEAGLQGIKNHLDGTPFVLPDDLSAAEQTLGVQIAPELKAAMGGNETAINHFNVLKEAQNKPITESIEKFHNNISNSVSESLGILPEDVAVHSENEAGHELSNTFQKEYQQKYGPISEAFEKRNAEAAKIAISDDARLAQYGKVLEKGLTEVGTDSPSYKLYNEWGNRILAKDTLGGIDSLKTEIGNEIEKAYRAADYNTANALKDIRSSFSDFQEQQITKQAANLEAQGANGAKKLASELLNDRAETNRMYKEFAGMSSELTDHLGTGRFTGAKGLTTKLSEKLSPEQLMNKFSFKGNSDFIPFLQKNFPATYEQVRQNEIKKFLKPAVLSAKGEQPLNINKLNSLIEKGMAGQKEYIESILPKAAIDRIQAANKLIEALPNLKSSGTAGHMAKLFSDLPRSALAGVAMVTGHNPIMGAVMGEMAQRLGRDMPDAIRLAHLKYLASDAPIKAEGFKSMVDFFHNTIKGENLVSKVISNIFKTGAQVLTTNQMPNQADRDKLDKQVSKMRDNPNDMFKTADNDLGHYLPNHQTAVSQTSANAIKYLDGLKPRPHILGPLDKPVPPQPVEIARYNRALDIAQQPAVVLQHIKDGTLQVSDIADLHNMYPGLYKSMQQKLTNQMISAHSNEEMIPYRSRVSMALFMGHPLDKTMEPSSIVAAQPKPKPQPQQQAQGKTRKGTSSLGKSNSDYQTPGQAAEHDRSSRD